VALVELTLPIAQPGGHVSVPLVAEFAGEVTDADLLLPLPVNSTGASVRRLAERHRNLARAVAGGMALNDAAALFGLAEPTVYALSIDPAFRTLVNFYTRADDEIFRSTQERLADVTNSALDLIEEKLEDPEERKKVTLPQALAVATMGADRTGHGPQSSSVAVNINANLADRMKEAREKARASLKDITPREAAE